MTIANEYNIPAARLDREAIGRVADLLGQEALDPTLAKVLTKNKAIHAVSVHVQNAPAYKSAQGVKSQATARANILAALVGSDAEPVRDAYAQTLERINGKAGSAAQITNGRGAFYFAAVAFHIATTDNDTSGLDALASYSMVALNMAGVALMDGGNMGDAIDAANEKTDKENDAKAKRAEKQEQAEKDGTAKKSKAALVEMMDHARSLIDSAIAPRAGLTLDAQAQQELDKAADILSAAIKAGQN